MKDLSTLELFMARQWLILFSNATRIKSVDITKANKKINDVDKELWSRIISNDTPWGLVEEETTDETIKLEETTNKTIKLEDLNFFETIKNISEKNDKKG